MAAGKNLARLERYLNWIFDASEEDMTKRSKILIVTRNLPPLVGGMERLNWHMADELSKFAEVKVVGPKGAAPLKPEAVTVTEVPLKPLSLFLLGRLVPVHDQTGSRLLWQCRYSGWQHNLVVCQRWPAPCSAGRLWCICWLGVFLFCRPAA